MALPGSGLIRFARRGAATAPDEPTPNELLAGLATPLLVIDPAGTVADVNGAAENFLNLGRTFVVGSAVETLIGHPLTTLPLDAPFAAYDIDLTLPTGKHVRADLSVGPLPDRAGWRVLTIHAQSRAVLAGRRADRDRGTMSAVGAAAMLAHEIKNPLSGIRGAAQLLEASADSDSRALTHLIRDEVDRIAGLIDRMEGFTDTRPLELSSQNIHAILGHAREVALQGFGRDVAIKEIYDPSLPAVIGHRDSLVQIFINLLKNAAEAMTEEGKEAPRRVITLTTGYRHGVSLFNRTGDGRRSLPIEVCVIDEGPGAPPELAEHLFDPFVSSKRSGRGLGLALVDKLVADQGGMIEYAREGTPERTVFRLLLPRAGGKL